MQFIPGTGNIHVSENEREASDVYEEIIDGDNANGSSGRCGYKHIHIHTDPQTHTYTHIIMCLSV